MFIRKIGLIGRTYRHIARYSEILGVLFKFGFEDLVISLKVEHYLDLGRQILFFKRKEKIEHYSRAERLRMALEELGPTFIKLGQMLSTRPDLLPPDFLEELAKLQDKVPPFEWEEAKGILEAELGPAWSEIFVDVALEPLAAASIGQVHLARLVEGEEMVAVKIQRPGIRRIVEVDLEILFHLATLMERHLEGWAMHRPTEVVEEFGRTMEREMDYRIEASNIERFAANFLKDQRIYAPKVFREATTERVLTMEYIQGIKADQINRLQTEGFDLKELAVRGADLVLEQILIHGFFHADPHPGNIVVLPGHVVCFLDLGMMGRLDRSTREDLVDLVMAVVRRNESALVEALLKLSVWEEEPDRRALGRELRDFIDIHLDRPLKELELGRLMQELFHLASKYGLGVPSDLLLLLKALTSIEGLGRRLDPDFDMIEKARPFVERVQKERFHPRRLAGDLWEFGKEIAQAIKEMPGELRAVLRLARQGRLKFEFEHLGLDPVVNTLDRTGNRLSFAIVLASLIIGSSLIVLSGIPPKWRDIPMIGLAGYLVAGIMGFWLLISILRGGRM